MVYNWLPYVFLSTLSLRRATGETMPSIRHISYFYPRSPCGERLDEIPYQRQIHQFLSTLSLRRATHLLRRFLSMSSFLSTLSLRRATWSASKLGGMSDISIHALLAESDRGQRPNWEGCQTFLSTLSLRRATPKTHQSRDVSHHFYPRSPCGERLMDTLILADTMLFLSTLSLRRATLAGPSGPAFLINFYPRSPCGERLVQNQIIFHHNLFLSTLSLRRAT